MAVARDIGIVCLVTRVCLTSAILTAAKVSLDPARATNIPRPWHSYLPVASTPLPWHPQYAVHADHAITDHQASPAKPVSSGDSRKYSRGPQLASDLNNREPKPRTGPQRFPTEILHDDVWLSTEVPKASPSTSPPPTTTTTTTTPTSKTTMKTTLSGPRGIRGYRNDVSRRYVYQDIEDFDGYLDVGKLPHRGKTVPPTYPRRGPQDITAAIKALGRFLSGVLNDDGYNSELHPPPNPVLALVLSRYGRYVPGTRNPRLYAYTAVNNIHNNQPFGRYKYECDEEPIYEVR